MTAQAALPFGKRTESYRALLPSVLGYLSDRGWVASKDLQARFRVTDRTVRTVASLSDGQIISGQKGYALVSQMPVADVLHAASWLRHQARAMERRALQIERAMHRRSPVGDQVGAA